MISIFTSDDYGHTWIMRTFACGYGDFTSCGLTYGVPIVTSSTGAVLIAPASVNYGY